ncbi:elongation of very long chain fatty acids protein F-like [Ceratitis capitata]|uniref:elongation of very long chain fatty acids protein F-like n=1 Tax=Ceratitis capitata TaxID=7213 RepID=UPI00032A192D|nr:elongation of very long chain fatty acids protein F-like [Ceratitis capitata]
MLGELYDFLARPSETREGYQYLPFHGALGPMIIGNVFFVFFAFRLGPWLMRNREPFNLKRVIMAYNIVQIFFNGLMIGLSAYLITTYVKESNGLGCIEQLGYDHPTKNFEIFCGLLYLFNKYLDYLETLFFIMRKSYKQVTILHVYHHIMMTTFVFLYIRIQGSGGHSSTIAMLNTVVHTVMYVYYLLSSIDPKWKKSLWWKKYITQMQIVQFFIDFIHQLWPLAIARNCDIEKSWSYIALTQATVMIYMFGKFYINSYIRSPKPKKVAEKKM